MLSRRQLTLKIKQLWRTVVFIGIRFTKTHKIQWSDQKGMQIPFAGPKRGKSHESTVSMRFVFWLVEKKVTEKLLANHKSLRYKKVSRQRVVETVQGSYIIWKSFLQALCIKCIYVSRASCLCDISQGYSLALETFKAIENSEKKFSAQGFWKSFLKYIVSYLKPIYMNNRYIYNLSVSCLWKRVENSVFKNLTYSVIRINLVVERLF